MSGFMGRPYITSLNTIHSAEDVAAQQSDKVNVDEDLSKYRIEEFFDIDMGEHVDYGRPVTFDAGLMDRSGRGNALATAAAPTSVDFLDSEHRTWIVLMRAKLTQDQAPSSSRSFLSDSKTF